MILQDSLFGVSSWDDLLVPVLHIQAERQRIEAEKKEAEKAQRKVLLHNRQENVGEQGSGWAVRGETAACVKIILVRIVLVDGVEADMPRLMAASLLAVHAARRAGCEQ